MNRRAWIVLVAVVGMALLLAACGGSRDSAEQPTPPADEPALAGAAQAGTPPRPTRTPSPTLPPTITPTESPPAPPPTETPVPTDTPEPYEHVIQTGDTCLGIAYQYGHTEPNVMAAIEELNNMRDCGVLPGPGTTLLIPRPTATATPIGADLTQTAVATAAPPQVTLDAGPSFAVQSYVVQDGDTLSSIAILFDSSLRQICELNPLPDGIDCGACNWESANCCCSRPVLVSVGLALNVPGTTPTPSPSPTFTGSETPTLTPTHRPPQPVFPARGATVSGPVRLTWVTVGPLAADETYLVTLRDETTGATFSATTRRLSLDVPYEYLPQDSAAHEFVWQVSVVRQGEDAMLYPTGGVVPEQPFTWSGW